MELLESGATIFLWIVIVLIAAVTALSTTDVLKLKDKRDDHS